MNLTEQQQAVIDSPLNDAVVLAGPGSGKTMTIALRMARMVPEALVPPSAMCAVSYTVAAGLELADRLTQLGVQPGYVGTLHGLCVRLLRDHAIEPTRFGILSEAEADLLWKEVATEQSATKVLRDAKKLARAEIGEPWIDIRSNWTTAEQRVVGCYYRRMREIGMLSFDAILHYAIKGLVNGEIKSPFTHVLVDESQDMAAPDARIYGLMKPQSLWFWGDPDQAIFGFRGAEPECLRGFMHRFPVLKLEGNHRSNAAVCGAAQSLISRNADHADRIIAPLNTTAGEVDIQPPSEPFETEDGEVLWITARIHDYLALSFSSIAILTRTNFTADWLAEELDKRGVLVQLRQRPVLPADWRWAVMLVGLSLHPNEMAMARYMSQRYGLKGMARATTAWSNGQTVRGTHVAELAQVPDILRAENISEESVKPIQHIIDSAPPFADATWVMAELNRYAVEPVLTGGGVFVGTIHSAKGREFDTVFIPACEVGLMPHPMGKLEEERRLMFVAVTRARTKVIVTWAKTRTIRNGVVSSNQQPSPFLGELTEHHDNETSIRATR